MIQTFPVPSRQYTVQAQARRANLIQWLWLLGFLGISSLLALDMLGSPASWSMVTWLLFWAAIIAVIYHPRNGVYLVVGGAMFGDGVLTYWYPVTKNFSSPESLLYAGDSFSFTPLEIIIALTFAVWIGRMAIQRQWRLPINTVTLTVTLFTAFLAFGLGYGVVMGGDTTMALWESRALFYVFPVAILVSALIETRGQVKTLLILIALPIAIDSLFGLHYVHTELQWAIGSVDRIAEHSLSIHFNAFMIMLLASWMFKGNTDLRVWMTGMMPFVLISYFANNRRSAFICLALALMFFAVVLYRRFRKAFWMIVPPLAAIGIVYIAIFWHIDNPIGAPAQAVKSVFGEPDPRDAASNLYREYETFNILYTIKASPIFGIGFGHKFYQPMPLPDISVFPFYEYIPHNSILWIWIKIGAGGFLSMLLMLGTSLAVGSRTLWRMPNDIMSVAALLAISYIVMHFVFSYVDMSWNGPNMVLLATMIALTGCLVPIVERTPPPPPKRWPWQPEPQAEPSLHPVRGQILP
jgi:hypothetical protein